MAKQDETEQSDKAVEKNIDRIIQRMDALGDRLDNIDSIVSAVAERVMKQPITMNVTCSKCGQKTEIAIIGVEKPGR